MNKELGKSIKLKFAAAGIGVTFLLSGLGSVSSEGNSTGKSITEPKNQSGEHLIPVPCTEPMPWENPKLNNNNVQTGDIIQASVKLPEPNPNRNQPECWIVVKDQTDGVIFEN